MPRKTKDEEKTIEEKKVKKVSSSKKNSTKKDSSTTKATKKDTTSKDTKAKSTSKKATTSKKTPSKRESSSTSSKTKKTDGKKTAVKKSSTKKTTTTKKVATKKETTTKKTVSKKSKIEVIEYYDLPYRYNQTVVKVLAQTPNTLFVYWDISDYDRQKYVEQYGEYFFNNTKPVLIVHNKTNNYTFEIDINDFANSWYLHVDDSDNDYQIELGRRPVNEYVSIQNDYLYITSSNEIETPNDHILFDRLNNNLYFRNVKTNITTKRDLANLSLLKKIGNISDIKSFYKKLYPNEAIDFDRLDLRNPSSATSTFK